MLTDDNEIYSLTELYLPITSLLEVAVLHQVELVYGVLLEIVGGGHSQGVVVAHRVVLNTDIVIRASNEGSRRSHNHGEGPY